MPDIVPDISGGVPSSLWVAGRFDRFEYWEVDNAGREVARVDGIVGGKLTYNPFTSLLVSGQLSYVGPERGWLDKQIRVYMVAQGRQEAAKVPLGTFLTTTPKLTVRGLEGAYTIDMYSTLLKLDDDCITSSFVVEKNDNIIAAVKGVIESAGMSATVTASSLTMKTTKVWEIGTSKLTIARELVDFANYLLSVDEWGNLAVAPYVSPENRSPSWAFRDDAEGIFLPQVEVEFDMFDTPNVVTAVVSNSEVEMSATVENSDPSNRYSTINRRRIVRVIDVEEAGSVDVLQGMAQRALDAAQMSVESVYLTHLYAPIRPHDVVEFEYVEAGLSRRLTVASMDIELVPGAPTKTRLRWFRS